MNLVTTETSNSFAREVSHSKYEAIENRGTNEAKFTLVLYL